MWADPATLFDELVADGRFAEADALLEEILDHDPDNADLLALRALVRSALKDPSAALAMSGRAVTLDRNSSFAHWAYGAQLESDGQFEPAERAASRALELDASNVDAAALLAQLAIRRGAYAEAVAIADHGLEVHPGHEPCLGLKAYALRYSEPTAKTDDAFASLLAAYPLSGFGRAGLGWSSLDRGDVDGAREHFEQALALDPGADWARDGLIEATKAKNPIYRRILRLFLWFGRIDSRTRWAIIIGGIVGFNALSEVMDASPALTLVAIPLMLAWVGFVLLSWTWQSLSDFVLMMDADARKLVTRERRMAALLVGGTCLATFFLAWFALMGRSGRIGLGALAAAFFVIPLSGVFNTPIGWPRQVMKTYTIGVAALIVVGLLGPESVAGSLGVALWGSVLGSWLASWLATRRVA